MKNEHATCRANNKKQKCLLGGNPAQIKNRFAFFFPYLLFFAFYFIFFILFNHLSQKANLKHIILSEPLLSLFIFSLFYGINLNFFYVFLFPWPRIRRAYTYDISWNYGWKLYEKKEEMMLDEKMSKVAKGKKTRIRKGKKIKNCSFMFLRFYVEKA